MRSTRYRDIVSVSARRTTTHTRGTLRGEEHRRLSRGVAASDDDDRLAGALARLELGGGVVHAGHLVAIETLDGQLSVVRPRRSDDRPTSDLAAVRQVHDEMAGDFFHRDDPARGGDLRAELLGLERSARGEVLTRHAHREADIVLDPRARARLSADRDRVERDRAQPFGRRVHRRGQAGWPRADDHDVVAPRQAARRPSTPVRRRDRQALHASAARVA